MPFAQLGGVSLYYEVHGGGPTTIVFAHGAGGSHMVWYQQVPYFRERYRCVTFDHRNYGQSVDESGEGWAAYPRDLLGLLDHLGIEDALLVAQSMGGFSCFPLAAAHPSRVRKLVMASTALGVTDQLGTAIIGNLEGPDETPRIGGFTPAFAADRPVSYFLYQQIAGLNRPLRPMVPPTPVTVLELAAFNVPTLFVAGSEDYLATPEIMRAAQAAVPGSRYELVRGAGHSVYWEKPDVFNHVVETFLSDEE